MLAINVTLIINEENITEAYKKVFRALAVGAEKEGIEWESTDQWYKDGEEVPQVDINNAILAALEELNIA